MTHKPVCMIPYSILKALGIPKTIQSHTKITTNIVFCMGLRWSGGLEQDGLSTKNDQPPLRPFMLNQSTIISISIYTPRPNTYSHASASNASYEKMNLPTADCICGHMLPSHPTWKSSVMAASSQAIAKWRWGPVHRGKRGIY